VDTFGIGTRTKTYELERWYRLASAAAHGREWALGAAKLEPHVGAETPPGVIHGTVSASDDVVLGLTIAAIAAVTRAVVDFERYTSAPAPVPILESPPLLVDAGSPSAGNGGSNSVGNEAIPTPHDDPS
jgi:hypothetical protein